MAADGSLDVIALVSGGKDSFFSLLHCLANGHRVVALANLYPPVPAVTAGVEHNEAGATSDGQNPSGAAIQQHGSSWGAGADGDHASFEDEAEEETDLNSFMYQTVGHQVIPLYAQATGLPLFRQPIVGTAVHHGISYQNPYDRQPSSQQSVAVPGSAEAAGLAASRQPNPSPSSSSALASHGDRGAEEGNRPRHMDIDEDEDEDEDETESLVPLLRAVMRAHPEANALCTGAILSTYQRTRIESVALRLGLVPLAYIWQFPELPGPAADEGGYLVRSSGSGSASDDAQLLRDMASVGLDARIIKVASAGLDESFLWENVASVAGVARVERAMRRFGGGGKGSILGEGGEFETLVVDGPKALFKGRVVVRDEARRIVREGGGCSWLSIREATVQMKEVASIEQPRSVAASSSDLGVRIPNLLDPRFEAVVASLRSSDQLELTRAAHLGLSNLEILGPVQHDHGPYQEWCFVGGIHGRNGPLPTATTVGAQTAQIVDEIRARLQDRSLPATVITNSIIVLRHMSDFILVNKLYGSLFPEPNPPSRVTISCGDILSPPDAAVAIYLSVQPHLKPGHEGADDKDKRRGLHVQSRSYWAPANIGPYSQAIAYPILHHSPPNSNHSSGEQSSSSSSYSPPLAVCIAGQIPLLPASMVLPPPKAREEWDNIQFQITLALQHLWRVGAEMQVRWWTSAVAYFPRTASGTERGGDQDPMRRKALLAASAWRVAHLWPRIPGSPSCAVDEDGENEDTEEEDGPDLWDRRFNPMYRSYAGDPYAPESAAALSLPDWDVLRTTHLGTKGKWETRAASLPPVFAAEVDELPRAAGVEWHAHVGLANVRQGTIRVGSSVAVSGDDGLLDLHHVVVDDSRDDGNGGVLIQSTALLKQDRHNEGRKCGIDAIERITARVAASLEEFSSPATTVRIDRAAMRPKITYVDSSLAVTAAPPGALIPCHSLWDEQGNQLTAVVIYETRLLRKTSIAVE
ncbi:hypothetical protein F4775DRAFT_507478 [Biscogniauxia sp. FL1348]|nr:hypothetical protein F4775DRAFT_507478 [Biscogniauxia sp. FL1348]